MKIVYIIITKGDKRKVKVNKMMNLEMMINKVDELKNDVSMWLDEKESVLHITIEDFAGFDEDWSEVEKEVDEEKVEAFLEMLKKECVSYECEFYHYYKFEGFSVKLGYTSYDI